jgi:hypothetical protein
MGTNDEAMDGILDGEGAIIKAKTQAVELRRPHDLAMREEVDTQVTTAKAYPRDLDTAVNMSIRMATMNQEVAKACIYALERTNAKGEKVIIDGPSVRLAEILVSNWGNLRAQLKAGEEGESFVTGVGEVWDMERNIAIRRESRRSILKRNGQRYGSDMIAVAMNAASSIAFREAVFKVIPRAIVDTVYDEARKKALSSEKSPEERFAQAVRWFSKLGVKEDRLLVKLSKANRADVDDDDIALLVGVFNRIKENESTVDEEFPTAPKDPPQPVSEKERELGWSEAAEKKTEPAPLSVRDRALLLLGDLAAAYKKAGTDGRKVRGMAADVLKAGVGKDASDWTEEDLLSGAKVVEEEKARLVAAGPDEQGSMIGADPGGE